MFSIGEEVKETNDSGFLGTVQTLHIQLLEDNSFLQVRPAAWSSASSVAVKQQQCRGFDSSDMRGVAVAFWQSTSSSALAH